MKSAFFIMELWRTGNVGSHNIRAIEDNPKDGYASYQHAVNGLQSLIEKDSWTIKRSGNRFIISEVFTYDK